MYPKFLWSLLLALLVTSCASESSDTPSDASVQNRWEDPVLRTIHDHQDASQLDSLAPYFESEDPRIRKEAALACASMRDWPAVPLLLELLEDEDAGVAATAAYALGQTGDTSATEALRKVLADPNALYQKDEGQLFGHVVEALGKLGNQLDLEYVLFQYGDLKSSGAELSIMRSIFRFGQRNIATRAAEELASDFIIDGENIAAAHLASSYFARRKELDPAVLQEGVLEDWPMITDPVIRMNIARAMKHLDSTQSEPYLLDILNSEKEDYRTKVNAVLAFTPASDSSLLKIIPFLQDPNLHISISTAGTIFAHADDLSYDTLFALGKSHSEPYVQAILMQSALKKSPGNAEVGQWLQTAVEQSEDVYVKRTFLISMGQSPTQLRYLRSQLNSDQSRLILSGAATALISMFAMPEDNTPANIRLDIVKEGLATGDDAVIALMAVELARKNAGYKDLIDDTQFIDDALDKMPLPETIEAYRMLQGAKYELEGEDRRIAQQIEYNHPIDWELAAKIDADATADIETNRGTISIRLHIDETPGTVVNFVELAERGYFEGKTFHRIVPNFVIQAGCPRGDGYGSLAETIRTEVPPMYYEEGVIGMASAGPDTESSQWFITHSATPHLDGRYSLFGHVIAGMNVVHDIQMGDQITKVSINYTGS